jgi:hypothetical protein
MDSKLLHDMFFLGLPVAKKVARPHFVVRYLYGHDWLERRVEGDPDVLIDDGVVQPLRS